MKNKAQADSCIRPTSGLIGALVLLLPLASQADYGIQVGAFRNPDNAAGLATTLLQGGFPARIHDSQHSSIRYEVLVGPYPARADAQHQVQRLAAAGYPGFLRPLPALYAAAAGDRAPGLEGALPGDSADRQQAPQESPGEAADFDSLGAGPALGRLFADDADDLPAGSRGHGISGFFQSELAYSTASPSHWSKFRNLLEIGTGGTLDNGMRWKLSGRAAYDAVFEFEDDFYPAAVEDDRRTEFILRETYLDVPAGDWDFRIGRQHIIWGEMVGLFFADVVSAKDMRQFVAQDFELLRIPQWALRAEHFGDSLHLEGIWIPYMSYDEIGKPGDDFFRPEPGMGVVVLNEDIPARTLSNSAYGVRLSYLQDGWDLSAFYYRSMDSSAAFARTLSGTDLLFRPEHHRIHQVGGTLAKDLSRNLILKAEAVYTLGKQLSVTDLADADGLVKSDVLDYIIGLEYTFDSGARVNLQGFQRWHRDHVDSMLPDEVESGYSLYAATEWLGGKLEPEMLWIQGLNQGDWMARPKLNWHLARDWRAALGADFFGGKDTTLFGQFDRSDRVYAEVRYSF